MDASDHQQIRQLFDDYLKMYASRDDRLTTYFSEDFSGFTGGGDFLVKDREEWVAITRQDFSQVKDPLRIELKDLAIQSLTDAIAVTTGFFTIHLPIKDHILSRETARLVLIFRKESIGWKITHSSISIPYYLVREGEVYPLKELTDRYQKLEEVIAKRTIQLSEANDKLQQTNEELIREITERKLAEKALQASEERYRKLSDDMPLYITAFIPDGTLTYVNTALADLEGVDPDKLIGANFFDMLTPDDRAKVKKQLDSLSPEQPIETHVQVRTTQHTHDRWQQWTNRAFFDDKGCPASYQAIGQDITESKQAEEALKLSEEKFRLSFMTSLDAFYWSTLEDGKILEVNRVFDDVFGYSRDEVIGRTSQELGLYVDPDDRARMLSILKASGHIKDLELKGRKKSGELITISLSVSKMLVNDQQYILGVIRDITERKQMESALRESEANYRSLFANASIGIFHSLPEGRFLRVNKALAHMLGYVSPEDMVAAITNIETQIYVDLQKRSILLDRTLQQADWIYAENRYRRKDGTIITANLSVRNILNADGTVAYLEGFVEDITERKRADEALRTNESRFRKVLQEISTVAVQGYAPDGTTQYWNKASERLYGYSAQEAIGRNLLDLIILPEMREDVEKAIQLMAETGVPIPASELLLMRKDGSRVEVFSSHTIVQVPGRTQELFCIDIDLTKRKRAEVALQMQEERLRLALASSRQGWFDLDIPSGAVKVSPEYIRMIGHDPAEFQTNLQGWIDGIHPEDRDGVLQVFHECIKAGDTRSMEYRRRTKTDEWLWICSTGKVMEYDSEHKPLRMIGTHQDITERKQAEEALMRSEADLSIAQSIAHIGSWRVVFSEGAEHWIGSDELLRIYGYPPDTRITMQTGFDRMHPDDRKRIQEAWSVALQGDGPFEWEHRIIVNSQVKWLHVVVRFVRDAAGKPLEATGTLQDITEYKRAEEARQALEERLHNAEKLEMMGTMAGRVAHDLNNVLGVVSGYSELLAERLPSDNPLHAYAANIQKSSIKAAAIIEDLLTLTRRGVRVMEAASLNKIIADLLATPEFDKLVSYHPNVVVKTDLAKDLLNVSGSPVHLEKTVMNLVSNAVEAITGSGEVKIKTENCYLDKTIDGYQAMKEGEYIVLTVSDTGKGIPSSELKSIFEPFYTRKSMGRSGTGLGLAIVWGAVQDHNGYIDVQSIEGKGSTFTLYFPTTRERLEVEMPKTPAEQYIGHGESVLVIDDVEEQRNVATALLMQLAYQVNSVSSGEDAVEYLKSNKADILVLDMIMEPGIDGLDTYQQILEISPHQKAIIVSGFSETDRSKEAQKLGAGVYVKKPYPKEKIGVAIRDELARK